MSKATQRGFTLIELVVVIVILGILAAFAVPRFINLQGEAREASVRALEGSVRSSASLARALALATGATASVTVEGNTVNLTNGYPALDSIDDTLQTSGFTYVPATGVFQMDGAPTPANCSVTYAPPAAADGSPTISSTVGGC